MHAKILIVDDEKLICSLLSRALKLEGYEVTATTEPEEGLRLLKKSHFDVMVTDLRMGSMDGLELLVRARKIRPDCEVVVMTGFASVETARQALTQGASDYITKPLDMENELLPLLATLVASDEVAEGHVGRAPLEVLAKPECEFVGSGALSRRLLDRVAKVARADISVLLQGESGTGKERIATRLHETSERKGKPFIKLNCAAVPDTLLESELFGHAKGAFTGATSDRDGLFKAADGGTLLLDEIAEISRTFQAKLLRVLQDGEFHRLGDARKTVRVDVRVIAATNRDLMRAVRAGDFREDLYYRLNVVPIDIPSLRERSSDVPELVKHFATRSADKHDCAHALRIPDEIIDLLTRYPWPGNIRELENAMESATVLAESEWLSLGDLPVAVQEFHRQQDSKSVPTRDSQVEQSEVTLEDIEMRCIVQAMVKTGFNRTRAANVLGVTRRTLSYRIGKYGLEDELSRLQTDPDAPGDLPKSVYEPESAPPICT
ncbi:MAG: sigma-54 dependent transcriptional regulator [Myxococcota bacterium]